MLNIEANEKDVADCTDSFVGMATALRVVAEFRFRQLAIWSQTVLGVQAPEAAGVRPGNGRLVLGPDKHLFPAQCRAEVWAVGIVAFCFSHDSPPFRTGISPPVFVGQPLLRPLLAAGRV